MKSKSSFLLYSLLTCCFIPVSLLSNELDVRISLELRNLPAFHRELLEADFEDKVLEYLSRRWTDIDFGHEQIPVEMSIFFQNATQDYRYSAQIVIVSSRPIFNQGRNTGIIRLSDDSWEFSFPPGKPLLFDEYSYDGLTTLLDFYAFLIIGLDFDTYEPLAGTPYFERAAGIARVAQRTGGRGWDRASTGYSKLGLVEDLLSSRNQIFREAIFHYHYNGLDLLAMDQIRALESIIEVIDVMEELRSSDPRNLPVRMFFDSKHSEIAEVLLDYPDRSVYDRLGSIDPSHRTIYDEYRTK
jgi:hypothetical protein